MVKKEKVELGFIDIPIKYPKFTQEQKNVLCDRLIDSLLMTIDKELQPLPHINRITFLEELIDCSIESNLENESYEVCAVLRDCKLRLNEV